jgi:hypothetical protein
VLDGRTLLDARIQSVLSDSLRIALQEPNHRKAQALATVLQSGALSAFVAERPR